MGGRYDLRGYGAPTSEKNASAEGNGAVVETNNEAKSSPIEDNPTVDLGAGSAVM